MLKFSIIIPIYTPYKKYIFECLESVSNQTYKNFECLLIVPKTQVEEFLSIVCKIDKRFRMIESDYTTQSFNRNIGVKNAKGTHIIFLDCDDMLNCNFLKIANNLILQYHPDICIFGYTRDFKEFSDELFSNDEKYLDDKNLIYDLFFSIYNSGKAYNNLLIDSSCAKVFKREVIKTNSIFFDEKTSCAEDALFVRDYAHFVNRVCTLEQYKAYYWRNNPLSTMNRIGPFFKLTAFYEHLDKISILENFNNVFFEKYKVNVFLTRLNSLLGMYLNNNISKREFLEFIKENYSDGSYVYKTFSSKCSKSILFRLVIKKRYFLISLLLSFKKCKKYKHSK